MSTVLVFAGTPSLGEEIGRVVQRAVPDVEWCVTCDWAGVVAQLFPTSPRVLLVDKGVLSDGVPSKLASVRRDLPWMPVIVLAEASELPGHVVLALVEARARHFVSVETLGGAEELRSALGLDGDLPAQLAAALRAHWHPRPVPAVVMRAVDFAVQRTSQRFKVGDMAKALGKSKRTLRRELKDEGALPPDELIQWGRALRAVEAFETDPEAAGETVAYELGFDHDGGLRRLLKRRLGVGIRGARALELEAAIGRFVREFRGASLEGRQTDQAGGVAD